MLIVKSVLLCRKVTSAILDDKWGYYEPDVFVLRIKNKSYHLWRAYHSLSAFWVVTVHARVDLKHLTWDAARR